MKELFKIAVIFALLLAVIPALSFISPNETGNDSSVYIQAAEAFPEASSGTSVTASGSGGTASAAVTEASGAEEDIIKVLDHTSGQVLELTMQEYVLGAVLAEMPATYGTEALKAQAVAARTYAYRQREKQSFSPDPELMGADISNDSSKYQAYFTPEQAKSFYGSGYSSYLGKAKEAVDLTDRLILVYDGEPIVAAFHSMSSGRTESAEVVWGDPVDYLIPVESKSDEDSPSYLDEKTYSSGELRLIAEKALPDAELSDDPESWFSIEKTSPSGTVTDISVGGKIISGAEFRQMLSLRSASFTISYDDEKEEFSITTRGYGHGVGMSQYGANSMAADGSDFEEILAHYYTGAELTEY